MSWAYFRSRKPQEIKETLKVITVLPHLKITGEEKVNLRSMCHSTRVHLQHTTNLRAEVPI